ncbi:futalosine hydrolase [Streptacidiphilus sp. MAP12-33]
MLRGASGSPALPHAFVAEPRTLPGGYELTAVGPLDVVVAGVGPAAAAAATATALALALAPAPYDLVVSSGIAGGFAPVAPVGCAVIAEAIVAADLGAQTPDGFADVTALGFGRVRHACTGTDTVARTLRGAGIPAAVGPVLTVSTVTGSAERAAELLGRHPGAVAEAMEGFGVAEAAAGHALPVLELRTVSNPVGPRDRAAWRIGDALGALAAVYEKLPYATLVG